MDAETWAREALAAFIARCVANLIANLEREAAEARRAAAWLRRAK